MSKNNLMIAFLVVMFFPFTTSALSSDDEFYLIDQETKYFKTIEYLNDKNSVSLYSNSNFSKTYEITKEEYDSALDNNISPLGTGVINTTYKEMTTSISSNGNVYRYKNILNWKKMPATRSYDIIGIGYLGSVKAKTNISFSQRSCTSLTNCTTTTSGSIQKFSTGVGVSFKLPEGNISNLTQTIYFDVEKNTTSTVVRQTAYGDYSHATSSITYDNAKKYNVSGSGIILNTSIKSYYDEIDYAKATWSGSW